MKQLLALFLIFAPSVCLSAEREMTDRRTAKSQHFFDAATGYGHSIITIHDQFYRDDNNVWQSVDENFEIDGTEGFAQKMEKSAQRIRIATDGTRRLYPRRQIIGEYIELGVPEFWNGSVWGTLPLGSPTRIGNTYIWDRPTYSLVLTATWRRLKIDVVLKTSGAARRIRWPVSLTGLTRSGTDLFGQDSTKVAVIDKPFAVDAASITFSVASTIAGGFIEFNADLTGAVFPVDIDPTFTTQPDGTAGIDTYMESGAPTTNHGTDTALKIGGEGGVPSVDRGLFFFDLSSISDVFVSTALGFRVNNSFSDNPTHILNVRSVFKTWTESGATWNTTDGATNWTTAGAGNQSDAEQTITLFSRTTAASPGFVSFTATAPGALLTVNSWFGSSGNLRNLGMIMTGNEAAFRKDEIDTSDNATAGNRPQFNVFYKLGRMRVQYPY